MAARSGCDVCGAHHTIVFARSITSPETRRPICRAAGSITQHTCADSTRANRGVVVVEAGAVRVASSDSPNKSAGRAASIFGPVVVRTSTATVHRAPRTDQRDAEQRG